MKLTSVLQNPSLKIILNTLKVLFTIIAYTGTWVLLWKSSHAFWFLPAGLRFVVLLYTRPVFWPIFLAGEWLGIVYLAVGQPDFSDLPELSLANFSPSVIYALVIAMLLRWRTWSGQHVGNQGELASIAVAVVISATAAATSLYLFMPDDSPFLVFEKFSVRGIFSYALGDIAGVLFIWSAVEFVKSFMAMDNLTRRAFYKSAAYLVLPVGAAVVVLMPVFDWVFLAVMFLPLVYLSLNYGWLGASFSLMTLNLIAGFIFWIGGDTGVLFDTQIFLVSVGFTGLFLGAAVSRQAELIESIGKISQRVITTQETERNRISRDLHDHIGQVLTALTLRIAIIRQKGPKELEGEFDLLEKLAAQVFHDVHEIVGELSPRELTYFGLKRSLESPAFRNMLEASNVKYRTSIDFGVADIPEQTQIAIFRIAQEALSNIVKHSLASKCSLKIDVLTRRGKKTVRLKIQDDGTGFDSANVMNGHGLQNIQDRVQALQGSFEFSSGGSGTLLQIVLPA